LTNIWFATDPMIIDAHAHDCGTDKDEWNIETTDLERKDRQYLLSR
jgi:hypothetical protein